MGMKTWRNSGASGKARTALLTALFVFSAPIAWASDELAELCKDGNPLETGFKVSDGTAACKGSPATVCGNMITRVNNSANELKQVRDKICQNVMNATSQLGEVQGQSEPHLAAASIYRGLKGDYEKYQETLRTHVGLVLAPLTAADGPLKGRSANPGVPAEKLKIYNLLDKELKHLRQDTSLRPAANKSAAKNDSALFAARNGAAFLKKVVAERDNSKVTGGNLNILMNDHLAKAKDNGNPNTQNTNTDHTTNDEDPTARGPGLLSLSNLNGLATLATAGMGLMQAMKSQQPTADTGGATSPTPDSANGPKVSSFGSGQEKVSGGGQKYEGKKTETTAPASPGASAGDSASDYSDISRDTAALATNSTGNGTRPGGGPVGGGGNAGGDAAKEPEAHRDPSAATPSPAKEDEALQGIGGGALGGGGPTGGEAPPSLDLGGSPPVLGADESMKDLLNEMKDTAEHGDEFPGELQPSPQDIAMSGEDLFPRVHACIVRKLKQGHVLNGFGDRISP